MKYDFSKGTYPKQKALEYLHKLIKDGSKASLTKIHPKRSTDQNSYLHVLFRLWGNNFGYTIDEAKQTIKGALHYTYLQKRLYGEFALSDEMFYCKTSKMDSKELTIFIEKFRDWSAITCEFYLPSPAEYIEEQIYFDNQIENSI